MDLNITFDLLENRIENCTVYTMGEDDLKKYKEWAAKIAHVKEIRILGNALKINYIHLPTKKEGSLTVQAWIATEYDSEKTFIWAFGPNEERQMPLIFASTISDAIDRFYNVFLYRDSMTSIERRCINTFIGKSVLEFIHESEGRLIDVDKNDNTDIGVSKSSSIRFIRCYDDDRLGRSEPNVYYAAMLIEEPDESVAKLINHVYNGRSVIIDYVRYYILCKSTGVMLIESSNIDPTEICNYNRAVYTVPYFTEFTSKKYV